MNFEYSKNINSKAVISAFFILCVVNLTWCIYRDIELRKQYPGDLRNRVVGSRLQMDGVSPYFYHWKESDGLRYYDWNNGNTDLLVSNITATPFFHQVISPIANFSQQTISKIWVGLNYLMLLLMVIAALHFCAGRSQIIMVIITVMLFLHSYAWTHNLINGQMYMFVPFLSMGLYYILSCKPRTRNGVIAGIFATSLVLIRPPTLVFLIPFLLMAPAFNLKYKLAVLFPVVILVLMSFGATTSRQYWKDYQLAVREHVKAHQYLNPSRGSFISVPTIRYVEGWDIEEVHKAKKFQFYKVNGANGNVFVFVNHALNVRTPVWLLGAMCFTAIGLLSFFFIKSQGIGENLTLYSIASLGFLLYMFVDMFAPVHRGHYNLSQWIFPLLLNAMTWSQRMNKVFVIGVFAGLLLNSLQFSMFPMQQSIGEYVICLSLIALLLTYKTNAVI